MTFGNKNRNRNSESSKRQKFTGGGKISAVEFQKNNPDRVNVYIAGQYAFSLAAILAAERRLKEGVELTAEDTAELQAADLYNKGLAAALQLLALRPRSQAEIQTYLRKRYPEIAAETVRTVVDRLKELNYLNDASFAAFWVENRSAFAPRGRHLLRQELMKKGVPRDIIDAAIAAQLDAEAEDEAEEGSLKVEESQALEMARKKARSYAAEDWPGFYRKLGGFLLRRGYDYDITGRVSRQVWQELKGQSAGDEEEVYFESE
jgi:regulatory protein